MVEVGGYFGWFLAPRDPSSLPPTAPHGYKMGTYQNTWKWMRRKKSVGGWILQGVPAYNCIIDTTTPTRYAALGTRKPCITFPPHTLRTLGISIARSWPLEEEARRLTSELIPLRLSESVISFLPASLLLRSFPLYMLPLDWCLWCLCYILSGASSTRKYTIQLIKITSCKPPKPGY